MVPQLAGLLYMRLKNHNIQLFNKTKWHYTALSFKKSSFLGLVMQLWSIWNIAGMGQQLMLHQTYSKIRSCNVASSLTDRIIAAYQPIWILLNLWNDTMLFKQTQLTNPQFFSYWPTIGLPTHPPALERILCLPWYTHISNIPHYAPSTQTTPCYPSLLLFNTQQLNTPRYTSAIWALWSWEWLEVL